MASVPKAMRAVLIKGDKGPSSALYIGDAPTPKIDLTSNNVIVKTKAFALNRMDLLQREGKYPVPPGASKILGVEFSGTVAEVGSGAAHFKVGDPVFGLTMGGAYAEYVSIPAPMLLHKPSALSWVQAAAIPEAFLTAYQALHVIGELKRGEDVLVHAGASSVGLAAIQLAKNAGANRIYVTAGTAGKMDTCKSLGATDAFNYKEENWKDALMRATDNKGVDIIMDFVGAPYFANNIASLKLDGRLIIQGLMGGYNVQDCNIVPILLKRLRIEGSTLRSRGLEYQSMLVQDFFHGGGLDAIVHGSSTGHTELEDRVRVYKVVDWKDIKDAQDEMAENKNTGKIVATIS
ncbi:hypothetical protein MVES_002858 [Malassezia vespertilionis]|uniref:Enoyl reductase (ER) domain-containing protein n=1 Tax=Malassezia vespertilionis TaxID=2020962 RepID=A0A2N1J9H8_9BASI|nr:hypothetical protein MVES_002858 [Malassezia vespertilionis]